VNPHLSDLISDCERVPLLQAYAVNENTVCLILDGHLGLELGETDACAIIPFILDCIETASRR
jgi:hypothetical protein